jgi:hypothetical protein
MRHPLVHHLVTRTHPLLHQVLPLDQCLDQVGHHLNLQLADEHPHVCREHGDPFVEPVHLHRHVNVLRRVRGAETTSARGPAPIPARRLQQL